MTPSAPHARIFEVGPRDGLQNEQAILSVAQRVELIERLVAAGARDVEMGSFVHPKWIPQMADTDEVARVMSRHPDVNYWALVPNMRGLERAIEADISHVCLFISASDTHNKKNLNRSIEQSFEELDEVFAAANAQGMTIRAYVSMVFGCPYEGHIDPEVVKSTTGRLLDMGADHVSLGDTIGVGTPAQVRATCADWLAAFGPDALALHLHDTRGMGVTNALVALEQGMTQFDSSVGGIGGCPYAPGAAGNLGSEDLIYLLDAMGVQTGYDIDAISQTAHWLETDAGISIPSRCTNYLYSNRCDV